MTRYAILPIFITTFFSCFINASDFDDLKTNLNATLEKQEDERNRYNILVDNGKKLSFIEIEDDNFPDTILLQFDFVDTTWNYEIWLIDETDGITNALNLSITKDLVIPKSCFKAIIFNSNKQEH